MPREPLFPHVPKSRQPQFPHAPKGQQPAEKLSQTLPQTGTCYADAWRFLIKQEEGELIHGSVQTIGKRINHAWVELPTGYLWEPEDEEFMKKSYFYERAQPQVAARYTAEEAAIMAARTKHFGPWSEQERRQYLGVRLPQTKEKLYQRGPDGYPVGADKIMRDAWGPIPDPDQPFWSGKGFIKPVKIYGWQWSPDYHSWRAYVGFPDGTETWTSPLKQTGGSLELLASTEGDPIRKFCCRQCGECAPKELLEEGRFLDRISWLRSHYQAKHPGMWGKMSPMTISEEKLPYYLPCPICFSGKQKPRFSEEGLRYHLSEFHKRVDVDELVKLAKELAIGGPLSRLPLTKDASELVSPKYRHLVGLINEPLPKDAY